ARRLITSQDCSPTGVCWSREALTSTGHPSVILRRTQIYLGFCEPPSQFVGEVLAERSEQFLLAGLAEGEPVHRGGAEQVRQYGGLAGVGLHEQVSFDLRRPVEHPVRHDLGFSFG